MDFPAFVRQRLKELGTEQRDLAAAAEVTESYISQLLTGKKPPPAPARTDIYDKMDGFLRLPAGRLATLAQLIRSDAMKRKIADPPAPLFREGRELILRKCVAAKVQSIRTIFEKEPFGALERLVTQKLLAVVKRVTREELEDNDWLRLVARHSDRSDEQMRVMVIEFLEVRIRRAGTRRPGCAGARLQGVPARSDAARRCDCGGNRGSRADDVHGQAANCALLLSRVAEPAGPPQLSAGADRGRRRAPVTASCNFIKDQDMTAWLWLILPAIALVIWAFRRRRHRDDDLGSVSVQWLQEHRRERHQDR